jgi:hypothetical protein
MGDFSELLIGDGVGDIHLNRFRIAFEPPSGTTAATLGKAAATLAADLVDNFPTYLKSEYATVEFGDRNHEGKRTFHFHGYARPLGAMARNIVGKMAVRPGQGPEQSGPDVAAVHDDWVVREWFDRSIGFTAQTLKREFIVAGEDVGVGMGTGALITTLMPAVGLVGAVVGGFTAVHYNRMHFLAGRRSWRIGEGSVFGVSGNVIVLETVAVERFSAAVYNTADWIADLEGKIPWVWIALLNNFVNMKNLKVVPQKLKARWTNKSRVEYVQLSFDGFGPLVADPEFQDLYRLYDTILPSAAARSSPSPSNDRRPIMLRGNKRF